MGDRARHRLFGTSGLAELDAPRCRPDPDTPGHDRQISCRQTADAVANPAREADVDLGIRALLRDAGEPVGRGAGEGSDTGRLAGTARHALGLLFCDFRPAPDLAHYRHAAAVEGQ